MTGDALKTFIGKRARFSTTTGGLVEGMVTGYCEGPSIEIQRPEGRVSYAASVLIHGIVIKDNRCEHCGGTGIAS